MNWGKSGPENTKDTIAIAIEKSKELNINHIVVASNTGKTVLQLLEQSDQDIDVVCVTHQVGFRNPGEDEMGQEMRQKLKELGVDILTTTHLFAGVDRALRYQNGGLYPAEIVANSLRMFSQGVKVGIEISVMALDAGLIPHGEDIIAIGGAAKGADTAILIRPEHSSEIFKTRVKEIFCKPQ